MLSISLSLFSDNMSNITPCDVLFLLFSLHLLPRFSPALSLLDHVAPAAFWFLCVAFDPCMALLLVGLHLF